MVGENYRNMSWFTYELYGSGEMRSAVDLIGLHLNFWAMHN